MADSHKLCFGRIGLGDLTLSSFGLLMLFVTLVSFGQVFMKLGLRGEAIPFGRSFAQTLWNIIRTMMRPWILGGLGLYVLGTFTWLILLSRVRLSIAYPMMSISYFLVTILSVVVLHEKVRWRYAIIGLAFIVAGVSFIGFGMGQMAGK